MTTPATTVFLVDDEEPILKALERLLGAAGFRVQCFSSAQAFLDEHDPEVPGCAVLDVAMDGLSGLELQQQLAASGCHRPIIFLSGRGNIPMSVQAMKAGAVTFLTKPVGGKDLLAAVHLAIEKDQVCAKLDAITRRLATLTPREGEVLRQVIAGRLNRQIAGELGHVCEDNQGASRPGDGEDGSAIGCRAGVCEPAGRGRAQRCADPAII
jgi:FixJ family two-component response regulator